MLCDDFSEANLRSIARQHEMLWRAEVDLLACLADSPRLSCAIVRRLGIEADWFSNEDTRVIFGAIETAALPIDPSWSRETIFAAVRAGLRTLDLWSEAERRPFITGRWGRGPLAALLCRIPFSEGTIVSAVARLTEVARDRRIAGTIHV